MIINTNIYHGVLSSPSSLSTLHGELFLTVVSSTQILPIWWPGTMARPSIRGSSASPPGASGTLVYSLQLPMMTLPALIKIRIILPRLMITCYLSVQRKIPTSTLPSDISTFMFLFSQDFNIFTPDLSSPSGSCARTGFMAVLFI